MLVLCDAAGSTSARSSLFPSETRRFSRPSTRFKRASRTSVFGPLFLGTASAADCQRVLHAAERDSFMAEHTVDTRAIEHLTCFTGRSCTVTFDLGTWSVYHTIDASTVQRTFRLRQLLQFMASRGSLETRRAGSRSMPI